MQLSLQTRSTLFCFVVVFAITTLVCLPTGIVYTVYGTSFSEKTTGILKKAQVHTIRKNDYYRKLFFKMNLGDTTCTIRRPTRYWTRKSVNDAVENTKLKTQRTVWRYTVDSNICVDRKLRQYYRKIGFTLLSYSGVSILFVTVFILIEIYFV